MQADLTLPEGYKLKEGLCQGYWVQRPDGSFIRGRDLGPKWYPTTDKAIQAAIEDADQECQNSATV